MKSCRMLAAAAFGAALLGAGCDVGSTQPDGPLPIVGHYTFLQDLEGWTPRATDVVVGDTDEIDWSIQRSLDRAIVPPASVRFYADNRTDAARLWLEKAVQLEPNTTYDVTVAFALATSDFGDVNHWRVLAGALTEPPDATTDFAPLERDDTSADQVAGAEFVWQEREYEMTVETDADGRLYVVVGIWGTSEFARTYYIDDLYVILEPR